MKGGDCMRGDCCMKGGGCCMKGDGCIRSDG